MEIGIHTPFLDYGFYDEEQFDMVRLLDEVGFSVIWVRDVPLHSPVYMQNPDQMYEAFTYLSYAAAITKRIKLGTAAIVIGERQPVLVAKMAASLDQLSRGRLILGVGSGDRPDEYAAFGLDYEGRYERTIEAISLMRALWKNSPLAVSGKFGRINGQIMNPPVHQTPGPPIWIVGNAGQSPRWIAENADGWYYHSGQHSQETIEQVRRYTPPGKHVSIAFSKDIALLEGDQPLRFIHGTMVGGAKAILHELQKYKSWGLDYFSVKKFVGPRTEKEQIIQFGKEVIPFL